MTIYIDVILLENLCMNYIILFGTAYISKIKRKHIRLILSSLIGAVYAVLAYTNIFPLYSNIIVKIILSICMIYVAFIPKTFKGLLKELVVFYLVSFSLGGCAFALLYIVRPQDIFMVDGVLIGTYPIKIALLGGILGFVITYISFKVVKTRMSKKELIYTIHIKIEDKELETKVLLDTGNMLKDPISNMPVALIEREKLREIIPKNILENTEKIWGGELEEKDENIEFRKRLRFIPFTSVGKQNGMILGVKVDEIRIITDVDEMIKNNAIIGIYEKNFSKTNKYFGIMGLDMLEGDKVTK